MIEAHNKQELEKMLNDNQSVLLDFYADWCGPCKMLSPQLEDLSSKRDDLKIVKVNIDKLSDVAQEYDIMSIPTLFLSSNNKVIDSVKGFQTSDMLSNWIDKQLK